LASGAAILHRLGVESDRLISLVREGDSNALEVIREAGYFLGLGIATVINIFNPSLIVLAGGTLKWSGYFEAVIKSAAMSSLPELWSACQVRQNNQGGDLVALGAIRSAEHFRYILMQK
jgi:predicted NBD/HSP70 family sugar kinase